MPASPFRRVLDVATGLLVAIAGAAMLVACRADATTGAAAPAGSAARLPTRVVAGYYPNFTSAPPRLRDIHPRYNVVYLFAAQPVGGSPGTTGAVVWHPPGDGRGAASHLRADIQYARSVQGRKVILSVGGDGNGMSFPNRTKSQTFLASVLDLYRQFGGIDGLDWNTFQASQAPDTKEMIWISLELKRRFPGFIISAPPAPWNALDRQFCVDMVRAGAMDYAAPQYYDGPNLADPDYVVASVDRWVQLLGEAHVVLGFGINNANNYMSGPQALATWRRVQARHPALRGAFDWEINTDEQQGWPFATTLGPLIQQ